MLLITVRKANIARLGTMLAMKSNIPGAANSSASDIYVDLQENTDCRGLQ